MKILFPFVGDSIGGSHISTLELYSSLVESNISAYIVLHKDNGVLAQYLNDKNIPFYVLKTSRLSGEVPSKISIVFGVMTNFFRFAKFIKIHEIDIVHGNDLRINLSWSLPAKIIAKGFVWHQRTLLSSSRFWLLIRYLCDYFVAISDSVMKSAPINIQDNQKKVIYNPFNVNSVIDKGLARSYIVKKYNIPSNCFLLGCVGRVVDYKNIDFIIKNISNIYYSINKNIYLIVAGAGSEEYVNELREYACNVGVSDHIIFTGFINNPNRLISSLDLLVAPSRVDAFGRTIVEAMLQKTPVLAAKSGGHLNIISEGVNGMFYDPAIKGDFIKEFSTMIRNRNVSVLSNEAYHFAQDNFSSTQHLNNMLLVYNHLLIS